MDALTDGMAQADVDAEMTALTTEDVTEQNLEASDEVEHLRNSLREAVHDDNVRPKMQCLMMDSSFSMVTMQGEDSGIEWETTPSRCTTPWASEAGNVTVDLLSPTPGSVPAGKIIFVMDEELISRRKKSKERVSSQKSKQREIFVESSENISGRPELVGVSQPNVKTEGEGDQEEPNDHLEDREQLLFSLVAEGSEILNIVVPQKLATVDEEESKEMVDNLSYLEESPVPRASEETHDYEMVMSITEPVEARSDHVKPSLTIAPNVTDPPGAPVARPLVKQAAGNVDYFEAYTLIDAQAPGSPAVTAQGQVEQEAEAATENQDSKQPVESEDHNTTAAVDNDKSDSVSLGEMTSELLDEVFYGGTDDSLVENLDRGDGRGVAEGAPCRLPSKPSGSNLFGSQEEILTPIFLPEGPPKIIDPILLEEPKAMAFLYTDLYEEAMGSHKKDEDTASMTSEKSFHSRHSDREARGYLEKYVLIDETPVVDVEPTDNGKRSEEGPRILSEDLYESSDFLPKPEKGEKPNSEEEITDFFRSSANSSPCDIEPFPRSVEEEEIQPTTKSKAKKKKNVSIKVEKVAEVEVDPLSISSFDFPSDELDWEITDDHPVEEHEHTNQELWKPDLEMQKPVAPPRKKATSSLKTCLDLTPLTPVEVIEQEKEEAGGKEQREEEKETASPAETADEGDGDGEEATQPSNVAPSENVLAAAESPQTESLNDSNIATVTEVESAATEEKDIQTAEEEAKSETEEAEKPTEPEEVDIKSSEVAKTEVIPEKQYSSAEPAKDKRQCIIL